MFQSSNVPMFQCAFLAILRIKQNLRKIVFVPDIAVPDSDDTILENITRSSMTFLFLGGT